MDNTQPQHPVNAWRHENFSLHYDCAKQGTFRYNGYRLPIDFSEVVWAADLLREYQSKGWILVSVKSSACKTVSTFENIPQPDSYGTSCDFLFRKGDAELGIYGTSGGPTLADALKSRLGWSSSRLLPVGPRVAGGKGQKKRVEETAARIVDAIRADLPADVLIEIPYETRGGAGGWRVKTAHRQFKLAEIPTLI